MSENTNKIKIKITEDGLEIPPNISLEDYGIFNGDICILKLDEDTGKATLSKIGDIFMDEIEKYDEQFMNIIIEESESIYEKLKTSRIPESGAYLLSFLTSLNSLKLGIYELSKSRDIYSLNVLYRSYLEHFIKVNYFYYRLLEEKNDNVGEDYKKYYSKVELARYGKSIEQIRKIIDSDFNGEDLFDILKEFYPELSEISSSQLKKKVSQFNYKNMIKYIYDRQKRSKVNIDLGVILSIIPEYSELSSFVHGGPSATISTARFHNANEVEKECCKIVRSTFRFYYLSNLLFVMIILGMVDKKYKSFYTKLNKVWEEGSSNIEEIFENI